MRFFVRVVSSARCHDAHVWRGLGVGKGFVVCKLRNERVDNIVCGAHGRFANRPRVPVCAPCGGRELVRKRAAETNVSVFVQKHNAADEKRRSPAMRGAQLVGQSVETGLVFGIDGCQHVARVACAGSRGGRGRIRIKHKRNMGEQKVVKQVPRVDQVFVVCNAVHRDNGCRNVDFAGNRRLHGFKRACRLAEHKTSARITVGMGRGRGRGR